MSRLENIKVILIQTYHPGNIGAVARAMKNMGLTRLILVNPVSFPHTDATSRAGKATDILDSAEVVGSLDEAIADCSLVVATSARMRGVPLPPLTTRQAAGKLIEESTNSHAAIVFGRERMGLSNADIQKCHMQVNIEASPEYPVLNISQAVQIICYELYQAKLATIHEEPSASVEAKKSYPLNEDVERFYQHLESTLKESGFINKGHPDQAMKHLRSVFRRARLTVDELQVLRGMLASLQK